MASGDEFWNDALYNLYQKMNASEEKVMSKSELTLQLEKNLWNSTHKLGTFGCFEVTIGWNGKERVDYVTYDTEGIWRFYEIKVSKADFHSKAKHSFFGHYNYFVMPNELYEKVKDDIPVDIGVSNGSCILKKARRRELTIPNDELKDFFIRSLQREYAKDIDSRDESKIGKFKRLYEQEQRRNRELNSRFIELSAAVRNKYGSRELRALIRDDSEINQTVSAENHPDCPLRYKNGKCLALSGLCEENSEIDCETVLRVYEMGKVGGVNNGEIQS